MTCWFGLYLLVTILTVAHGIKLNIFWSIPHSYDVTAPYDYEREYALNYTKHADSLLNIKYLINLKIKDLEFSA